MPIRTGCSNCGTSSTGMMTLLTLTRRYATRNRPVSDFENFCDSCTDASSRFDAKVRTFSVLS